MTDKEVKYKARELLKPYCRVCPECNGVACRGEVPGMGGKGSGKSFMKNFNDLEKISIKLSALHDVNAPKTEVTLLNDTLSCPVYAAPITGTVINMGGKLSEKEYIDRVVDGCHNAGIIPMVGDSALETFLTDNLDVLKKKEKSGIVFIKPWENEAILSKMELAYESNVSAIGIDIDAAGLVTMKLHGKSVETKTFEKIKELKEKCKLPLIIKGIMTVEDAIKCADAGVDAIVVSNHGGRVLDYAQSSAAVLEDIASAVKGRVTIFADGGVRTGLDVFKMLALGADGVLIGRPFVTYSFGGGAEAVEDYINRIKNELIATMTLTGAATIKDINRNMIVKE